MRSLRSSAKSCALTLIIRRLCRLSFVFVSRSRGICKIICTDECGTTLITRKLHKGRFERLLMQAQGPAAMTVTPQMLADFINGKPLFVKRESLWQG